MCTRAEPMIGALIGDSPDITHMPVLNPGGPGDYRVRVYASNRGHNWDGVDEEPVEQYLIQVWPATPASEQRYKVSSDPNLQP